MRLLDDERRADAFTEWLGGEQRERHRMALVQGGRWRGTRRSSQELEGGKNGPGSGGGSGRVLRAQVRTGGWRRDGPAEEVTVGQELRQMQGAGCGRSSRCWWRAAVERNPALAG